jgi:hypothetical protein
MLIGGLYERADIPATLGSFFTWLINPVSPTIPTTTDLSTEFIMNPPPSFYDIITMALTRGYAETFLFAGRTVVGTFHTIHVSGGGTMKLATLIVSAISHLVWCARDFVTSAIARFVAVVIIGSWQKVVTLSTQYLGDAVLNVCLYGGYHLEHCRSLTRY